jgi:hypothetical protein
MNPSSAWDPGRGTYLPVPKVGSLFLRGVETGQATGLGGIQNQIHVHRQIMCNFALLLVQGLARAASPVHLQPKHTQRPAPHRQPNCTAVDARPLHTSPSRALGHAWLPSAICLWTGASVALLLAAGPSLGSAMLHMLQRDPTLAPATTKRAMPNT